MEESLMPRWSQRPQTLERMSVHRLLRVEKVTHLGTNGCPQIVLAKLVVLEHGLERHETTMSIRPSGRDEDILRRPID